MKTLKSLGLSTACLLTLSFFLVSCSRTEDASGIENNGINNKEILALFPAASSPDIISEMAVNTAGTTPATPLTYCNEKTVPFCESNSSYGNLSVKRGSDTKIYATFTAAQGWYLAYVSMYTGTVAGIPTKLASLPYRKTFNIPFPDQSFQFVLTGQPDNFSVVGYVILVKKNSYGMITSYKTLYADGCAGIKITCTNTSGSGGSGGNNDDHNGHGSGCRDQHRGGCDGDHDDDDNGPGKGNTGGCNDDRNTPTKCTSELDGGKYFNITAAACVPPPPVNSGPSEENLNICASASLCFFGLHPSYDMVMAWPSPTISFAGNTYTEAEGRAIAGCADVNGVADSKFAFIQVLTLRLSGTDYLLSPNLTNSVQVIENALASKGKLSPQNIPTGLPQVKQAADKLATWIKANNCPERR